MPQKYTPRNKQTRKLANKQVSRRLREAEQKAQSVARRYELENEVKKQSVSQLRMLRTQILDKLTIKSLVFFVLIAYLYWLGIHIPLDTVLYLGFVTQVLLWMPRAERIIKLVLRSILGWFFN